MTTRTNHSRARGIVGVLGLVIAALLVLSTLGASEADAKKKKKHHKPPPINIVQCPTESDGVTCLGTGGRDRLVGRDAESDIIKGKEGGDVYKGKGGNDVWFDESSTSNDTYLLPATEFSSIGTALFVSDRGGSSDVLDLSSYSSTDFALDDFGDDLIMDGPGKRDVRLDDFFYYEVAIDYYKFSDGTLTWDQILSKAGF
jgi:hypothetical protein